MIAMSARQLVVAHDQYGCASWSASTRALFDRVVHRRSIAELEEILDEPEQRREPVLRRDLAGGECRGLRGRRRLGRRCRPGP